MKPKRTSNLFVVRLSNTTNGYRRFERIKAVFASFGFKLRKQFRAKGVYYGKPPLGFGICDGHCPARVATHFDVYLDHSCNYRPHTFKRALKAAATLCLCLLAASSAPAAEAFRSVFVVAHADKNTALRPTGRSAVSFTDADAVRAIVGEAANQGRDGMLAVACAIRNRGSLKGVYGLRNPAAGKQPAWCWERARTAWASSLTNDTVLGATHWENTKAFGTPYWAKSLTPTVKINAHQFYK